jgi:hypothetical protein
MAEANPLIFGDFPPIVKPASGARLRREAGPADALLQMRLNFSLTAPGGGRYIENHDQ